MTGEWASGAPNFNINLSFMAWVHSPRFCPSFRRAFPRANISSAPTLPSPLKSKASHTRASEIRRVLVGCSSGDLIGVGLDVRGCTEGAPGDSDRLWTAGGVSWEAGEAGRLPERLLMPLSPRFVRGKRFGLFGEG